MDVSLSLPQSHFVVVATGEQFLNQRSGRSSPVGLDVDQGRLQFRMLEGQHPCEPTKLGLRQGDSITEIELLCAAGDDPQPWAVAGADLRQCLDQVSDQQRA